MTVTAPAIILLQIPLQKWHNDGGNVSSGVAEDLRGGPPINNSNKKEQQSRIARRRHTTPRLFCSGETRKHGIPLRSFACKEALSWRHDLSNSKADKHKCELLDSGDMPPPADGGAPKGNAQNLKAFAGLTDLHCFKTCSVFSVLLAKSGQDQRCAIADLTRLCCLSDAPSKKTWNWAVSPQAKPYGIDPACTALCV